MRTFGFAWLVVAAIGLASGLAQAQELEPGNAEPPETLPEEALSREIPTTAPTGVEVIRIKGKTVTAMETEVPSSVSQFDPATIAALGAQNIADLAKVTPNVEIRSQGATTATFFVRGVGLSDFNANAAGAVAIYQDDVSMNLPALQLGQLYDLANVSVLRGPQGHGPGRNASAGAIKIASRKPTDQFEASLRVDLGVTREDTHAGAGFGQRDFEGALQIPLIDEVLSSRFAFRLTENDPFRKNGCSTRYVPSQEERDADAENWVGETVCGINRATKFIDNPNPPPRGFRIVDVDPTEGQHKVNDSDNWAARGALRFQPPEVAGQDTLMEFNLNFHGSRLDQQSTLGQVIGTTQGYGSFSTGRGYQDPDIKEMEDEAVKKYGNLEDARRAVGRELARNLDKRPYRGDYNRVGQTALDTWGTYLRGDFQFGDDMELTVISAYDWYDRNRDTDSDFTPEVLFETVSEDDAWQFVEDVRLSGEVEEYSFRWSLGGIALIEELDNEQTTFLQSGQNDSEYTQKTWSFGIYAGFEVDLLEDFTLEIGGRYNWERKQFDFLLTQGSNSAFPVFLPQNLTETWDSPTGTITLRYRWSPEVQFYSKLSRGWKGGHFNGSATVDDPIKPAEPETITAAETGFKALLLDDRVRAAGSFFYYRYEDYQVFIFDQSKTSFPNRIIVNANDAETIGAELELTVFPIEDLVPDLYDGLSITMASSWLRSEFIDFTQERRTSGLDGPSTVILDYSGNPLINAPEWKVVLTTEWPLDFGSYGTIVPRYDGVWTDDVYFDPTKGRGLPDANQAILPKYAIAQRAHWMHNIRLAYRFPEAQMEIAAYVRNVEDRIVKTYAFDASLFAGSVINFVNEPRTFGLTLSFKF